MKRLGRAIALTGAVLAVMAPEAPAAATRAEYAAQVNPICVETDRAVKGIPKRLGKSLKGLPKDPAKLTPGERRRLIRSVGKLTKVIARIEQAGVERIAAVAPAPGDELLAAQFVDATKALNGVNRRSGELTITILKAIPPDFDPAETGDDLPKGFINSFVKFLLLLDKADKATDRLNDAATQLGATSCKERDPLPDYAAASAAYVLP